MIGNFAKPGVTENVTLPDAPLPVTSAGASAPCGVTAIGLRTVAPPPVGVRLPVEDTPEAAVSWVKVTLNCLVSPAAPKLRIDSLTVALTPGTLIVAR